MPDVSILLPVRNEATYLHRCLRSLVRQSFSDFEIVLVDDGSTDATLEICEGVAASEPRLRVIPRPGRGLIPALNETASRARGELLARMDADDLAHRDRLQKQVAFFAEHPDTGVVGCLVKTFPRRWTLEGMLRYEEWLNSLVTPEQIARDLFVESPFAHPSVMMRREAFESVGGYQDNGWAEDYDLWMRMALAGGRFGKVPEVLHFWRDRPDRLSRAKTRYSIQNFRRLKMHYLKQSFLKDRHRVQVWGAGRSGKVFSRVILASGMQISRFIDIDPKKIGGRLKDAPVCDPSALDTGQQDPLLVVVGVKGARELIRARLDRRGWVEHRDYVCIA